MLYIVNTKHFTNIYKQNQPFKKILPNKIFNDLVVQFPLTYILNSVTAKKQIKSFNWLPIEGFHAN